MISEQIRQKAREWHIHNDFEYWSDEEVAAFAESLLFGGAASPTLKERHEEPFGTTDIFGSDLDGAIFLEPPTAEAKCNCNAMALSGNGPMPQNCSDPNCQYFAGVAPPAASPQPGFELEGSLGKVTVRPGQRFMDGDVLWEIVRKTGRGTYSPFGLGGTASVACKVVSGAPDGRFKNFAADGTLVWCGDSLASAVIAYQRTIPAASGGQHVHIQNDGSLTAEDHPQIDMPQLNIRPMEEILSAWDNRDTVFVGRPAQRDLRNLVGQFMLVRGIHMGDKIDAGRVQDLIEEWAIRTTISGSGTPAQEKDHE